MIEKNEKNSDITLKIEKFKQLSIDIMSHYGYTCGKVEVDANTVRKQANISIIITSTAADGIIHQQIRRFKVT